MLLVGCYFDWMFLVFAIFALAVFALADLSFAGMFVLMFYLRHLVEASKNLYFSAGIENFITLIR